MKGALHPCINLAPEFFTSISQNVAWRRRQECFPLWNHVVAVVVFDLSLQRKAEVQFIWNKLSGSGYTQGEDPEGCMVFLRAHSFSALSWGHWCRRRSGFGIRAANYHFLLNWQCPTCGDPRAGMKCRWGTRCGILMSKGGKTGGGLLDKPQLKTAGSKAKHTFMIITLTLIRDVSMRLSCRIAAQQCGC